MTDDIDDTIDNFIEAYPGLSCPAGMKVLHEIDIAGIQWDGSDNLTDVLCELYDTYLHGYSEAASKMSDDILVALSEVMKGK